MSNVITLTHDNFDREVLASDVPVVVDYWAPWCGPCRMLGPVIEQIASDRAGTVKVGKVNVDEEPALAERAGVRGIPYVVLYRDGEVAAQAVGAQPKPALEQALGLDTVAPAAPVA
ncbi:MAG TPA: thioredoxin [Solirubrobacteraceae bacterium]|jgi:thioredoxin 1